MHKMSAVNEELAISFCTNAGFKKSRKEAMKKYIGDRIYDILPMRYPYMILNCLKVEEGTWAEAEIDLKEDDWFFKCHFPENPILPGFLLLESMTQVLLSTFIGQTGLSHGQVPLMTEIKDVHLDGFCVPGDKVIIRAELKRFKYGIAKGDIKAYKDFVLDENILAGVKISFAMPGVLGK